MLPEIIVSDLCPPGRAYILNREALGLDGGELIVVADDKTRLSIADAIERRVSVLRQFAAMMNLGVSNTDPAPVEPDPASERDDA